MADPKKLSLTQEEHNLLLNKRNLENSMKYLADLVEADCKKDIAGIRQRLTIAAEDNVVVDVESGTLTVHKPDPKAALEKKGFVIPRPELKKGVN
ncbi:hypothetical protein HZB78_05505 [Candidatus Collierbacteria bacterium]|nr:hypothetical protein [Candidatus Collierbacteria bacterium]